MTDPDGWRIYRGTGVPHDGVERLPPAPPWRHFGGVVPEVEPALPTMAEARPGAIERALSYRPDPAVVDMANAAILLRRPLLVTGRPGTGKSSLATSIAYELDLGPVLYWPVTSRSRLEDALYHYDAIGRLQEANLHRGGREDVPEIGRYLRLGPLGTALLPRSRPRVLLIDELDKSDLDLPNDLLNVFEEGQFEIPELTRLSDSDDVRVSTADPGVTVVVESGVIRCHAFPIVVITNNAEREFPAAFLRRCMRVTAPPPSNDALVQIVAAQLGEAAATAGEDVIARFVRSRLDSDLATDQLLNAIYLATSGALEADARDRLVNEIFEPLTWNPQV